MDNKFTVTLGQLPSSYINRAHIEDKICNDFFLDFPLSHICMIINSYVEKSCSVYRDRLIKRGLIVGLEQGKIMLTLPRFEIFISNQE